MDLCLTEDRGICMNVERANIGSIKISKDMKKVHM